jgi:hypothetical protein
LENCERLLPRNLRGALGCRAFFVNRKTASLGNTTENLFMWKTMNKFTAANLQQEGMCSQIIQIHQVVLRAA